VCSCLAGIQVDLVSLMDLKFLTSMEKDADESVEEEAGDSHGDTHQWEGDSDSGSWLLVVLCGPL